MQLGEVIRNKGFRLIDFFRNSKVKSYISELQKFESENEEVQFNCVEKKLNSLLLNAQSSCPFYYKMKGNFNLNTYPVITKQFIANNEYQFRSDKYINRNLIEVTTSGSYGTPFCFHLTKQKKRRQSAEAIFYSNKAGYEVGMCHAYFRTELKKSNLAKWLQNEILILSKVLDLEFLINTRYILKKKKIKILIGFPSAISLVAKFCLDKGDYANDFAITGVITFAESLTVEQAFIIQKIFNCKVLSRYGTEELGILGYREGTTNSFHINTCNYIVEVLKLDENVSALPGEIGRVVVTDLHSDALPLIRYETGDLAILGEAFQSNINWAKELEALSGRTIQILYSTNGAMLYPLYFENIIEEFPWVAQFQLIQESSRKYTLKLVPRISFSEEFYTESQIKCKMLNWLGKDAIINIELVSDIEMLPSGKRPVFINKCLSPYTNLR